MVRINANGLYETVDLFTGEVVAVQSTPHDSHLKGKFDNLVKITTPEGKEVWIERHMDPEKITRHIRATNMNRSRAVFSLGWAKLLAGEMLDGATLTKSAKIHDIPLRTVKLWMAESPEFAEIIDQARSSRAETLQDEALDHARLHKEKEPALLVQTAMKQATTADPEKFNIKQKVEHSGEVAHTFVIETGIRRGQPAPQGFEDAIRDATAAKDRPELLPSPGEIPGAHEARAREAEESAAAKKEVKPLRSVLDAAGEFEADHDSATVEVLPEDSEF